ncbi:hypothetical protein ACOSP7_019452 [Xanthoceras sorbifolium]
MPLPIPSITITAAAHVVFVHDFAPKTSGSVACSGTLSDHLRKLRECCIEVAEKCPYPEDTCTPEAEFVHISDDEDVEYPEDGTADSYSDDMADSEYSSESKYNPDSCEVVQEDDTGDSDAETVPAATHVKSGHTTNVTKAFNSWVDKYRHLPALLLLENVRHKVMKLINTRFRAAQKWTSSLIPMVNSKIAERLNEARFVDVMCASEHEFENPKGGTKRGNLEVGNTSTSITRRKLNLGDSANGPGIQNV